MEKDECFEKFREYSEFFSSPIEHIDFLEGISPADMTDRNVIGYISPLLNEMFDYSLVYPHLDLYYIQGLSDDNRTELYDKANEVVRACNYYMADLYDNSCTHPSVLRYGYMEDGVAHFEIMKALLEDARSLIPGIELDEFDRLYGSIDKGVMIGSGKQFLEIASNIKRIHNPNTFMRYLSRSTLDLVIKKLLLFDEDDTIDFVLNDDRGNGCIVRNVTDDKSLHLLELFTKIEELKDTDNKMVKKYIDDLCCEYIGYKTSQYRYLQYSYLEAKILKKCGEM